MDSTAPSMKSKVTKGPQQRLGQWLPREFYARDPRKVSRDLLGKLLVRCEGRQLLAARMVEVEAYLGSDDPAAHAASGRTLRNAVIFGAPGHAYVYFIYGNHYCLNVSCMPEGEAGCVLVRALEPLTGIPEMARARGISLNRASDLRRLTTGPGRLAEAFGITRARDNGKDLTRTDSDLWISDDGYRAAEILSTVRIGITKAAERPLRYFIRGNQFVSGPRKLRLLAKR
jgi:DNA-3-methyladenine glycosylase